MTARRHIGPDRPPSKREILWIAVLIFVGITLAVAHRLAS